MRYSKEYLIIIKNLRFGDLALWLQTVQPRGSESEIFLFQCASLYLRASDSCPRWAVFDGALGQGSELIRGDL